MKTPHSLFASLIAFALLWTSAAGYPQADEPPARAVDAVRELYQAPPELNAWRAEYSARQTQTVQPDLSAADLPAWTVLAFESYRSSNWDIYFKHLSSSSETRLTFDPAVDMTPALYRGGARAAFSSKRGGNYEIYTVQTDGSNAQRLTFDPASDVAPAWSPDGSRIAFQSYRAGNWDVFVMNADGSGLQQLTSSPAYDGEVAWSPDGERLAWVSKASGRYEIWLMDADGAHSLQLTSGATAGEISWSPDGERLAFSNDSDGDLWLEVWTIDADGSNARIWLPAGLNQDRHAPIWSPNGRWLGYIETSWIYYQGDWYWTTSYLKAVNYSDPFTWSVDPYQTLSQDSTVWSADWASLDVTPPENCTLADFAQPKRWSSFLIDWTAPADDLSGAAVYDVQFRLRSQAWQTLASRTKIKPQLFSPPENGPLSLRCRAYDVSGNVADWSSAPVVSTVVDADRPASQVWIAQAALPGAPAGLEWGGTDLGAGVASYDIWMRDGAGGDWTLWLNDVTTTTGLFQGLAGHTYYFRSQATDQVGHQEPWQAAPQAVAVFYQHLLSGTGRDNRGLAVPSIVRVEPAAMYSHTAATGVYTRYLAAGGVHTLTASGAGYGSLPPVQAVVSGSVAFDAALPPAVNWLSNGGFESGALDGWQTAGPAVITASRYAGAYALQMGPALTSPVEVSQVITLDTALHMPTLAYVYQAPPALTGGLMAEATGLTSTQALSSTALAGGWRLAWADLSPYAGQVVTVTFRLSDTASLALVDEASVGSWTTPQVSGAAAVEGPAPAVNLLITGANFISAPTVFLGQTPLTQVTWLSSTRVSARVPAGVLPGEYELRLANPGGAAAQWSAPVAVARRMIWLPVITNAPAASTPDPMLAQTTDWLTLGGNPGRTGYHPLEAGASRYTLVWTSTLPLSGGHALSQLAVADGVVAAVTGSSTDRKSVILALSAADGHELWRIAFTDTSRLNPPAISQGIVYFQHTGSVSSVSQPPHLQAVDLYTGHSYWQAPSSLIHSHQAPLIVGGRVYVNDGYGGLTAYHAGTGAALWRANLELSAYDGMAPAFANGRLYTWVAGNFREHDLATGAERWRVAADWSWTYAMNTVPVMDRRTGLVASSTALTAIDLSDRAVRWAAAGNFQATVPATADGVVYALNSGTLEARRLTDGELLWTFAGDNQLTHAPIVAAGYIYVASDAHTYVLDRATHSLVWQADHGGWLTVANGYLYIAQADNVIYAYQAQEP